MAQYLRHDRARTTDPLPLRRVVRQRPLTEDELRAMYAEPYIPPEPEPESYEPPRSDISPPGVVRPGEWTDDVAGDPRSAAPYYRRSPSEVAPPPTYQYQPVDYPSQVAYPSAPVSQPPASPWVPREHWAPRETYAREYVEEEPIAVPMRRSRLGWALVALIVLGAAGLLGYAVVEGDVFDRVGFGEPELSSAIEENSPVDRPAVDVGNAWVVVPAALGAEQRAAPEPAEPSETAEAEPAAAPKARAAPRRRPEPNRTYTYQRPSAPAPATPPTTTPYPNVESDRSLDRLQQEVQGGIGTQPAPAPAPKADPQPPADLKVPEQYKQPETSDDIVRDPGF